MSILNQLIDKFLNKPLKSSKAYIERGNRYFSEDNLQAALADYEQAVVLSPDRADQVAAYFNRGRTRNRLGNPEAALADLDRAVELAPTFSLAYGERGICYASQENHCSAVTEYDKIIALSCPGMDQAMAYHNRAISHEALGDLSAALADINKAIEIAPGLTPAQEEKKRIEESGRCAAGDRGTPPELESDYRATA